MSAVNQSNKADAESGAAKAELARSLIGRQPILDREGRVQAYELLFRSEAPPEPGKFDGNKATANVILNALTEFDLDDVIGTHKAFINFTGELLTDDTARLLPKERVVIEVLEDVALTPAVVDAVIRLAKDGYHIALDDFVYSEAWEPLMAIAGTVKLDVLALDDAALADHVARCRKHKVMLLAEKVEDADQHARLMAAGFDLFQGYYYARPNIVAKARIPQNHLAVVRLLAALNSSSSGIDDIERLVAEDVSLSYRLLRYINSAFIAPPQKVDSIRRAVVFFGLNMLRQWTSLIVMASVDGKPKVLMQNALVRARMCEALARASDADDPESFFTVGLFSILDSLLDTPMATLVEPLPLSNEIIAALVRGEGDPGAALKCVVAYERCQWSEVCYQNLEREDIGRIYLDSIEWAFDAASGL